MAKTLQLWLLTLWLSTINIANAQDLPNLELPNKLSGSNVLVLFKQNDALSHKIADYYAQQRHIPVNQVTSISLPSTTNQLSPQQFSTIMQQLKSKLTPNIKVILLTFHAPYRVGCMSITSAFAFGFDEKYCGQKPSNTSKYNLTAISPYYNNQANLLGKKTVPSGLV